MKLISFQDALAKTQPNKRHLLLGNGFSRALRNDIFNYTALFDRAKGKLSPTAQQAFAKLGTTNFEEVMRALRHASALVDIYAASKPSMAAAMEKDLNALRDVLAATIAESHPDRPHDVTADQYKACKEFLVNFKDIYTCNYDLLVYWTLMQDEVTPAVEHDDGFRTPASGVAEYVTWDVQNTNDQNVFYLHGALHIFDAGHELQKYTWVNTNRPLIEQIREALGQNRYPLFVSEGTADEKLDRIQHSSYLGRSYRSFANSKHPLFIFGLSLADNDDHITRLLETGQRKQIFIGVFGDSDADWNKPMIARAMKIMPGRDKNRPITIEFYDAATAQVWGAPIASKAKKS